MQEAIKTFRESGVQLSAHAPFGSWVSCILESAALWHFFSAGCCHGNTDSSLVRAIIGFLITEMSAPPPIGQIIYFIFFLVEE